MSTGTLAQRFWPQVQGGPVEECWEWRGPRDRDGYGRFGAARPTTASAHRFAYLDVFGPIPDGLHLDHLCQNRACVNPWHLDPVTAGENARRAQIANGLGIAKTHCPNGHAYDKANTYRWRGERRCIRCARQATAEWRDRQRGGPAAPYGAAKTHCIKGHEYTPENTGRKTNGARRCRACARDYAAQKRAAA